MIVRRYISAIHRTSERERERIKVSTWSTIKHMAGRFLAGQSGWTVFSLLLTIAYWMYIVRRIWILFTKLSTIFNKRVFSIGDPVAIQWNPKFCLSNTVGPVCAVRTNTYKRRINIGRRNWKQNSPIRTRKWSTSERALWRKRSRTRAKETH